MSSIHSGHRSRIRERFAAEGLENFEPHEVLEIMLFYALPRGDVNPLAHRLIDSFGSLSAVFDASAEELMKVSGVGENAAMLIKLIPEINRYYLTEKAQQIDIVLNTEEAGKYLVPYFHACVNEMSMALCIDGKGKVLGCEKLFEGNVNSTVVSIRRVVAVAMKYNAASVILAHNHTSGVAIPSEEDKLTTKRIREALEAIGVNLIDHLVVAEDDFVSMAESGIL